MWSLFVTGVTRVLTKKSLGLRHQGHCHLAKSTNVRVCENWLLNLKDCEQWSCSCNTFMLAVMERLKVKLQ